MVSGVQVLGKSLIMLLPISPIDYDGEEVPTPATKPSKASNKKRVQTELIGNSANPILAGVVAASEDPASVLLNTDNLEQSNNPLNTPPVNTEQLDAAEDSIDWEQIGDAGIWPAEDDGEEVIGEEFANDNTEGAAAPSIVSDDIHPRVLEENRAVEPLTAAAIAKLLGRKGILYHNTDTSKALYARWVNAGIKLEQLVNALNEVNSNMSLKQSPQTIDEILASKLQQKFSGGTGRGRVAI